MKMEMSDVLKNRDAVPRDLATLIDVQAAARPEALAIIAPIGRLTYGAVSTMISRIAAGLASAGLKPGDNVAVTLGKNVPELLTILALSRIGCTACIRFGTGNLQQVDVAACIHADDARLMGPRPILFDPAWLEMAPDAAQSQTMVSGARRQARDLHHVVRFDRVAEGHPLLNGAALPRGVRQPAPSQP